MCSSVISSDDKAEDDTKNADAQSCTVLGWKPVQSAARLAASVMQHPQTVMAVAIMDMAG